MNTTSIDSWHFEKFPFSQGEKRGDYQPSRSIPETIESNLESQATF